MIHAYLTDGFFDMAVIFLKSLKKTNGYRRHVVLSTRDLADDQIDYLHKIYTNLTVENERLDWRYLARVSLTPMGVLRRYKQEIERNYVTPKNKIWKLMIAAEDRPMSLRSVVNRYKLSSPILHFDIDTLFLRNISEGFDLAANNDLCLLYRPNYNVTKARVTISTIGLSATPAVFEFLNLWISYIKKLSPRERPIGYGQTSFYYALQELRHKLRVHTFDHRWGYPGIRNNMKGNFVWSGAIHKMNKSDCVNFFQSSMAEVAQ